MWIVAVQFDDSGVIDHRHLRRVRRRKPDSHEHGESTIEEMIELIRAHTAVYVSDDLSTEARSCASSMRSRHTFAPEHTAAG